MQPKQYLKPVAALATLAMTTAPVAFALAAEPAATPYKVRPHLQSPLAGHRSMHVAFHDAAHRDLVREYRNTAREAGTDTPSLSVVRQWSSARLRRELKQLEAGSTTASASGSTANPALQSIAACESGGDPHAIGGGGLYRGKYQMTTSAWASVGGSGDPAGAPESEQDRRAAMLLAQSGPGQWPVCGS
jgi:hypothetical protein